MLHKEEKLLQLMNLRYDSYGKNKETIYMWYCHAYFKYLKR